MITAINNKTYTGALSPGCQLCVDLKWSCVYLGLECTRDCFWCTKKHEDVAPFDMPTMKKITSPQMYLRLIESCGYLGTGFSGGEPLLKLPDIITYIRAIRREFGKTYYLWLYTNGDLLTEGNCAVLLDAGLDELRFDIAAADYDLKALKTACRIIGAVSVEIPAIPDDKNRVISLLPELATAGVRYLNLHQLFATPYNEKKILARGYGLKNGAVTGSEETALEIIDNIDANKLNLSANYCSLKYKCERYRRIIS